MEVILRKDVDKIGKIGAVVKVKDGFARNFLIPNGLAVSKNAGNLKKLEQEKKIKNQELDRARQEAQALKDKLSSLSLTIPVLTQEDERLYGSIGPAEIAHALSEEGFEIDKSVVVLEDHIKALGIYEVALKIHPEVPTKIKVWIVKK